MDEALHDGRYPPSVAQTQRFTCGYGMIANLMGWKDPQTAYAYMREWFQLTYGTNSRYVAEMPTVAKATKARKNHLPRHLCVAFLRLFYKVEVRTGYVTLPENTGTYVIIVRWKSGTGHYIVQKNGLVYDSLLSSAVPVEEYQKGVNSNRTSHLIIWKLTPLTNAEKKANRKPTW